MTKFNGKPEAFRKLDQKFSQNLFPILGRERWRQLNQDNLELRFERLDRAEKCVQFGGAIAQPADVRDFARKFAAETKRSGSQFHPAPDRVLARDAVESRIDFDRRKIAGIEFQPFGIGQFGWIKAAPPIRETPGAGADSNFLLISEIQI